MTAVGSSPASARIAAIIVVVVVLPWLPATATPSLTRISSPSISARGMTGMPRARAAATSGLSARTALETTTTSARGDVLRPVADVDARAPALARRRVTSLSRRSEPDHRVAEVQQHLGDAGHADAADADEVDGDVALPEHGNWGCSLERDAGSRPPAPRDWVLDGVRVEASADD